MVAAERRAQFANDTPLLVVPDVLAGLRDLAAAARARTQAKVIGVTGSVGKTGTKEALRLALSKDGETHASVASYNNHWGVPLSLARCPASARYAVLEMGMNHAGEIAPLSRLARPHVALITTIAPVHLEFFGSLAKIADAKAEIFLGLEPDGAAVLNRDIAQFAQLKRRAKEAGVARIVSFGEHAEGRCAPDQMRAASALLDCGGADPRHRTHLQDRRAGPSPRDNSLAVLATAVLAGADLALAALALAELKPVSGRGAPIEIDLAGGAALGHRRELQRQPGLGRRRAGAARPGAGRPARPAYRRARRHARTRTEGPCAAPRAGQAGRAPTRSISCSAAGR